MLLNKVIITVLIYSFLFSFALTTAFANDSKVEIYEAPKEIIDKIKEEGMGENSQVMDTAEYLTEVIGGRLTNSPNMKRANIWTRDRMKKWGLENTHLESWGPFGRGWSLKEFSVQVIEPQSFPVIAYPKAWSPSTKGEVVGNVVHVKIKKEEDLAKYKGKLKNAIVLMGNTRALKPNFKAMGIRFTDKQLLELANAYDSKDPRARIFSSEQIEQLIIKPAVLAAKTMNFLIAEGAAAIISNSRRGSGGTVFVMAAKVGGKPPKNLNDLLGSSALKLWDKEAENKMLPQMMMATENFNRLMRMTKRGEKVRMKVNIHTQYHDDDLMGYNTIAEIPGVDPKLKDEIVMVGAHLDSWHASGGATDNASGSSVVMEASRIIKALDLKPRRTIRVALWSGEEQGLHGSKAYVKKHFGEMSRSQKLTKKANYEKFSAYYNMDNGTGKFRGVYLQGNSAVAPIFRAWLQPFNKMGASTITLRNAGGTDHLSFDRIGLPGFQFIQDRIEYFSRTWHSSQDNFDRLIPEELKHNATIMAAFAYQTSMMDEKLPRKPMKNLKK